MYLLFSYALVWLSAPQGTTCPRLIVGWILTGIALPNNYRVLFAVSGRFRFRDLALFVWQETSGG